MLSANHREIIVIQEDRKLKKDQVGIYFHKRQNYPRIQKSNKMQK